MPTKPLKSPARPPQGELKSASPPKTAALSLKEQIALRRAEAKKLLTSKASSTGARDEEGTEDGRTAVDDDEWNAGMGKSKNSDGEEDLLGRPSVKDVVERARETGASGSNSCTLLKTVHC